MKSIRLRPISCSLEPNTGWDDVGSAIRTILMPWTWRGEVALRQVRKALALRFPGKHIELTGSGRVALAEVLGSCGIKKDDEVVVQAFTCMVVVDAVRAVGAKPVFADIDATFNLNPETVSRILTGKTRAVIVQHTFGVPADVTGIGKLRQRHPFILIEDCAHGFGACHRGKSVGSLGDAAILSFGRDKALSSVWGGAAVLSAPYEMKNVSQSRAPGVWILSQLLHPVIFGLALPLYALQVGKLVVEIAKRIGLVSKPVDEVEKNGGVSVQSGYAYPNALARLLMTQLGKFDGLVAHRRGIARYYREKLAGIPGLELPPDVPGSSWLRFPVVSDRPEKLFARSRAEGIYLGTWYRHLIDPAGSSFRVAGYREGTCPVAEKMARGVVNLPTNISRSEAGSVVDVVKKTYGQ